MRKVFDRRFLLCGSLAIGLLMFTGIASGTVSASKPNVYWACVPQNGSIRLIDPGKSCKRGESLIKWYQTGAKGGTGATGSAGSIGATGSPGGTGLTGGIGSQGVIGLTGNTGSQGVIGLTGNTGSQGVIGLTGNTGSQGVTGNTGPAGSNGVSGYAYYYNVGAQTVAIEADILFDTNGLNSPVPIATHTAGTAAITVASTGVYKASFIVSATEVSQMAVFLNGTAVAGSTYGSGAGTQQNSGQVIFPASAADVITVRNHSSAAAVGLPTNAGGTQANVNASIMLEKLS
jgi:collagen type I alpha